MATLYFTASADDPTSEISFSDVVLRDPLSVAITAAIDTFGYIIYLPGTGAGDCMLCDFDCDGDIDTRDFVLLSGYWQPANEATGDVGPATGTAPSLTPVPDGSVNYEDLFIFGRMWNWYHLTVLGHSKMGAEAGEVVLLQDNDAVSVSGLNLPPVGMAHIVLAYDPLRTRILSTTLDDMPSGFVSDNNGVLDIAAIRLAHSGESAEVFGSADFARIEFDGENTFRIATADLRNGRGEKVLVQTTSGLPYLFSVSPVVPNPFNPVASFTIILPRDGSPLVEILDISGHRVALLNDGKLSAGTHTMLWDGSGSPSGVYYIKVSFRGENRIQRALLIK